MEVDTISKHGIKIRNISAGSLYETNLGIRDFFISKEATLDNSLFYFFLKITDYRYTKKRIPAIGLPRKKVRLISSALTSISEALPMKRK